MGLLLWCMVELAVAYASACTHALYVPGRNGFHIAHAVLVGQFAAQHITDDFHVLVAMGTKTLAGFDTVFVNDAQSAPAHVGWIVVTGEGKAVERLQPPMVCITSVI
jgi:hypothetical protein